MTKQFRCKLFSRYLTLTFHNPRGKYDNSKLDICLSPKYISDDATDHRTTGYILFRWISFKTNVNFLFKRKIFR